MTPRPLVNSHVEDGTGFVFLDHSEGRNVLSLEMREQLLDHYERMSADTSVRAIVLAGKGTVFCAGGDLKTLTLETGTTMLQRQHNIQKLMRSMMTGDKPVIAAVEGAAMGAGLSLAMACDIVVAGSAARFGAVFGKVGLAPDLGLTWTLPRRIGMGRTRLMLMTGRIIAAEQAAAWGLVDELVTPGAAVSAASKVAAEIAGNAPLPTRMIRRSLAQPFADLDQALEFESLTQSLLISTDGFKEGYAAFIEKRKPHFDSP